MPKLLTASCAALLLFVAVLAGPVTGQAEAEKEQPTKTEVLCDAQCVRYVEWVEAQKALWIRAHNENQAAQQGNWLAIMAVAQRYFAPNTDWGWLARTIERESCGTPCPTKIWKPTAENPTSSASGLLQMLDMHNHLLVYVGCPPNDTGMYIATCALGAGAKLHEQQGERPWFPRA